MTEATEQKRKLRNKLFNRQRGKCCLCSKPMTLQQGRDDSATLEHLIPKSLGGELEKGNVKVAHRKCNIERGNTMGLPASILGMPE